MIVAVTIIKYVLKRILLVRCIALNVYFDFGKHSQPERHHFGVENKLLGRELIYPQRLVMLRGGMNTESWCKNSGYFSRWKR